MSKELEYISAGKALPGPRYRECKRQWNHILDKLYPFKLKDKHGVHVALNLADTTFERFHGGPNKRLERDLALKLAEGQDERTFSRDPYVQLEKFYINEGNDAEARRAYYKGRKAYRRAAKAGYGGAEWTGGRSVIDWLWQWSTRYSISLWPLILASVVFLIVGTFVFSPSDHLTKVKTPPGSMRPSENSAQEPPNEEQSRNTEGQDSLFWENALGYRAAVYSVDQFLPLVNLHVDERWEPSGPWLHLYAVVHALVGWLIVPLLIAALAGIMRR